MLEALGFAARVLLHLEGRDGHAAGSTTFERKLVYSMPNPLLALIDLLVLRRRAAAELAEALRRLEYGLEGSAA